MTGYTVHTGSSEKFSQGWDEIFKKKPAKKAAPAARKTALKKAAKKVAKGKKK